jgi:xanthine dehydrogenase YagS FAD-binding subunit
MRPFAYSRATDSAAAVQTLHGDAAAKFLGGGTNLIDLMKEGVEQPERLVDINRLPLAKIEERDDGVRLGALARNSDVAHHPFIQKQYPLLAQSFLSGATPQLRNLATVGGNLMQRTRCYYFYDIESPCNKSKPGTGCAALAGFNRIHAILGASDQCIATNPSDMCVALLALDAVVEVEGPKGRRTIPIAEFHRLPGTTPERDTNLEHGELITAVDLPKSPFAQRAHYLKIRDRASYAFALVSVAAALDLDGDKIRGARVALGGVAHKPWRSLEAEKVLVGETANETVYAKAADILLKDAKPYQHNGFKVELAHRAIIHGLQQAREGTQPMDFYVAQI